MNRYEGVTCPVCGKPFTEDDLITVCPVCGTPHHVECYRQSGHCAHEDWHASGRKFVLPENTAQSTSRQSDEETEGEAGESTARQSRNTSPCPRCGSPCEPDAMFCRQCGFPVAQFRARQNGQAGPQQAGFGMIPPYAGMNPDEELTEGITVREYAAFIGPAAPQYLLRFKRMAERGKSVSWNFLFGIGSVFYLCYRKMYRIGIPLLVYFALFIGVYLTSTIMTVQAVYAQLALETSVTMDTIYMLLESAMMSLPAWLLNAYAAMRFTILPIMIVLGLFGDKLYFSHCTNTIRTLKENNSGAASAEMLAGKGGVNRKLMMAMLLVVMISLMITPFISSMLLY